jgi:hypothetical protein
LESLGVPPDPVPDQEGVEVVRQLSSCMHRHNKC